MIRSLPPLPCLALALLACAQGEPPPLPAGVSLAIVGVVPLDPAAGQTGEPSTLLVAGDRIAAVVPGPAPRLPPDLPVVDGGGRFAIPGLWDLHTHLAMLDDHAPPLLVTQGVLGVRDMGAVPETIEAVRRRVDSGDLLGPRILRAGPTLNGAPNGPHHRVIGDPAAARAAIAELAAAGFDFVKTHNATGRETYFALLEAAAGAGLAVGGHVPVTVDPREACAAGQASIEHIATLFEGTYLAGFDDEMAAFLAMPDWLAGGGEALAACFAERGTLFVPTLRAYELRADRAAAYDHPDPAWRYLTTEQLEKWRAQEPTATDRREDVIRLRRSLVEVGQRFVGELAGRGAPIGAGTDIASPGLLPGFDLHAEIRLLAGAGLTPAQAVHAATRGPGPRFGADPLTGRLAIGAPADLVLLRANPFDGLAALDRIDGVVLRGRWLDRRELDAVLERLERE